VGEFVEKLEMLRRLHGACFVLAACAAGLRRRRHL
jgi:hypothetical protein